MDENILSLCLHLTDKASRCTSSIMLAACRALGVDHVFMTVNDPAAPDPHLRAQLRDFVAEGFLTLQAHRAPHAQPAVMRRCIREHRESFNWLAFFDADEFLLLREPCALNMFWSDPEA